MFKPNLNLKTTLVATTLVLSAFSLSAQAALTSYTNAGKDLVYSSVSDVTWTKDANLMKTLMGSNSTSQWATILNGVAGNSGLFITNGDFSTDGSASWNGAIGFINYLNSINYGGSNQWYLPTVVQTSFNVNSSTSTNGTAKGDEFLELFYQELNGTARSAIPNTPTFDNEQASIYWYGTEATRDPRYNAWQFDALGGSQDTRIKYSKSYAWAVSPGRINTATPSAVPVPATAWLFGSGLVGLAGLRRRKQAV